MKAQGTTVMVYAEVLLLLNLVPEILDYVIIIEKYIYTVGFISVFFTVLKKLQKVLLEHL